MGFGNVRVTSDYHMGMLGSKRNESQLTVGSTGPGRGIIHT